MMNSVLMDSANQISVLNIAGYRFLSFTPSELNVLNDQLVTLCEQYDLKGTILLSPEGINISLAGVAQSVRSFMDVFLMDTRFSGMTFHETYSHFLPFQKMKVKIKSEIITFKPDDIRVQDSEAPSISPELLKHWLDSKRDIVLLDTRNDYEIKFGTFDGAVNLHINDFSEFADAMDVIGKSKPIVMFCTGGIRCEKASLYMLKHQYQEVYQLKGGILGYFAKVGGAHYHGDCFVFDERIAVQPNLAPATTTQCKTCQSPVVVELKKVDYPLSLEETCADCVAIPA